MRCLGPIFLFLVVASCSQNEALQEHATERPPNIIYIIADDLGYGDVSFNGQEKFKTPNIDRLAAEGMFFRRHYSGSTVCAPSRSVLMTGLHTGHTQIRGNREMKPEGQYPLADSVVTIAEVLQENGYVTGAFGKWGLGGPGSEGDPVNQGFDRFFGYNCQRLAHNFYTEYLWDNRDTVWLTSNLNGGSGTYSHDIIHEQAMQFIDDNKDKPFFLFMPYTIPHAEILAPEDSILEQFMGQYPEEPYDGYDEGPKYRKGPYGSQENPRAHFAAMVTRLDLAVGDVLSKIEQLGLEENTIIMFTSDNGPHLEGGAAPDFFNSNGDLRGYKRDLYEGGIRVPFVVKWDGKVKPGSVSDHISAFWDFYPTVADLLDLEMNSPTDGISFLPEMTGQQQVKHGYLYWEFHEQGGRQAILKDNWKGVRLNMTNNPDASIALYDLNTDVQEQVDVAVDHPEIVAEIEALMKSSRTSNPVFGFKFEQSR